MVGSRGVCGCGSKAFSYWALTWFLHVVNSLGPPGFFFCTFAAPCHPTGTILIPLYPKCTDPRLYRAVFTKGLKLELHNIKVQDGNFTFVFLSIEAISETRTSLFHGVLCLQLIPHSFPASPAHLFLIPFSSNSYSFVCRDPLSSLYVLIHTYLSLSLTSFPDKPIKSEQRWFYPSKEFITYQELNNYVWWILTSHQCLSVHLSLTPLTEVPSEYFKLLSTPSGHLRNSVPFSLNCISLEHGITEALGLYLLKLTPLLCES